MSCDYCWPGNCCGKCDDNTNRAMRAVLLNDAAMRREKIAEQLMAEAREYRRLAMVPTLPMLPELIKPSEK